MYRAKKDNVARPKEGILMHITKIIEEII